MNIGATWIGPIVTIAFALIGVITVFASMRSRLITQENKSEKLAETVAKLQKDQADIKILAAQKEAIAAKEMLTLQQILADKFTTTREFSIVVSDLRHSLNRLEKLDQTGVHP